MALGPEVKPYIPDQLLAYLMADDSAQASAALAEAGHEACASWGPQGRLFFIEDSILASGRSSVESITEDQRQWSCPSKLWLSFFTKVFWDVLARSR